MLSRLKPFLSLLLLAVAMVAAHLVMRLLEKEFCLTQLTVALYYSIVVMGLSLVMGYAGQVSLGHGAFFALGGYTSAFLTTCDFSRLQSAAWAGWLKQAHVFVVKDGLYGGQTMTVSPWAAFAAALLLTLVVAVIIGYPALRLKGHYLAMATLGFGMIVHKLILGSSALGSADGITGVPEWNLGFGLVVSGKSAARVQNYYIACGLALLLLLLLGNMVRSRVGRALQAIHDRELAANAMGINTPSYKLKTFVLSALLAALAGVFLTHYTSGIGPSEAGAIKSVRYVALAAAGGMANLWGVTVVSTVFNYLSLRDMFGSYDHAVFGGLLIVIISLAPDGPLQPIGLWLRKGAAYLFCRRKPSPVESGARSGADLPRTTMESKSTAAPARESSPHPTPASASPISPKVILEVENVRRSFGGLVAVDRVAFKVETGQIKAVIGPNGAGKTTLFNIISGVLRPNLGRITFKGREIAGRPPYYIAQEGVSRTFQNPSLFLKMSVLENVMIGRHRLTRSGYAGSALRLPSQCREERRIREGAMEHLEFLGLSHLAQTSAGSLSFGERRMVELARALATEPELLLLDEPASGLNTREKERLGDIIRKIKARGITLLLVEHDMSLVMDVSDDILVLYHGTPIAEGPPSVVQNDQRVISVYLGGELPHAVTG
jgi:branched-chain amino acid transport system permease protein